MSTPDTDAVIDNTGGVWECGHCHGLTTETHFFLDLATQTMAHEANAERRAERAAQCGWRCDDDYGTKERCQLRSGHLGNHRGYTVHWSGDDRWIGIPPAPVPQPVGGQ